MHIRLALCSILLTVGLASVAQTARQLVSDNPALAASNYLAYPAPTKPLTKAPRGYKPFYISHYGRHGSRWHIGTDSYSYPFLVLDSARQAGALTPFGQDVCRRLSVVNQAASKRFGELTRLGHEQHAAIADRMFHRFPEVFRGATHVDAKSTVVIRCILSMTAETQRLSELNPDLVIVQDASEHDMFYMNAKTDDLKHVLSRGKSLVQDFSAKHTHPERLINALFADSAYAAIHVSKTRLFQYLFRVACNQQSLDFDFNFDDLFADDERYDLWQCTNASWYVDYCNSPATLGLAPYRQRALLQNILDTADSCVVSPRCNVTLRFGHEVCVLPLVCLMELDDSNVSVENLDELADKWQNFRYYPMASNVQLIFYRTRRATDDILVKVLLNENEARLPIDSDFAPYYRWRDVEAFYRRKLASFSLSEQ